MASSGSVAFEGKVITDLVEDIERDKSFEIEMVLEAADGYTVVFTV
jgi:hypothetical protein